MPDLDIEPTPTLEARLAAVALATPGVLRMVPTLKNALRQLRPGRASGQGAGPDADGAPTGPDPASPDGITVAGTHDTPTVTVDLAITGPASALGTALAVQAAVSAVLREDGVTPATVRVNVLELEPAEPADPGDPGDPPDPPSEAAHGPTT